MWSSHVPRGPATRRLSHSVSTLEVSRVASSEATTSRKPSRPGRSLGRGWCTIIWGNGDSKAEQCSSPQPGNAQLAQRGEATLRQIDCRRQARQRPLPQARQARPPPHLRLAPDRTGARRRLHFQAARPLDRGHHAGRVFASVRQDQPRGRDAAGALVELRQHPVWKRDGNDSSKRDETRTRQNGSTERRQRLAEPR